MPEIIDTFFAVDFDRCLGNFDAMMVLINAVAKDMSDLSFGSLAVANEEVKASGRSFSLLQFIEEHNPKIDVGAIEKEYIKRAQAHRGSLLESGAAEFLDYLKSVGQQFCIMTFGDKKWQTAKITASGLGGSQVLVVDDERKGHIISQWWDSQAAIFIISGDCFNSKMPSLAREVVLIDDKPKAFLDLPAAARGYLVSAISQDDIGIKLPDNVAQVASLIEIIELEKHRKSSTQK